MISRQFRLLFAGQAVSVVGDGIVPLFGTRPTMLACGLIVIVLCALALAAGDFRRLTAP